MNFGHIPRVLLNSAGLCCVRLGISIVPMERRKLDVDQLHTPAIRDPNSAVDRVLMIFDRTENGNITPEFSFVNVIGFCGMFIGGIYGGVLEAHLGNLRYRESNEATLYASTRDAQRKLQDAHTVAFGRGAFRWGFRTGMFCFLFSGIATIVSAYRNKDAVLEWSIAGMITGAIFKISLGSKGMISGAFFGTLAGTFAGLSVVGILKAAGATMNDMRNVAFSYFKFKDESYFRIDKPPSMDDTDDALLAHIHKGRDAEDVSLNVLDQENAQVIDNTNKIVEGSKIPATSEKI